MSTQFKEKIHKKEEKQKWGFPKPTILFDAQSQPTLIGNPIEQMYYRMFLMGKPEDIALINYPIDEAYMSYIKNVLGLQLPQIVQIPRLEKGTMTRDALAQPEIVSYLSSKVADGSHIQFFNFLEDEIQLATKVRELSGVEPTYAENVDAYLKLGTKTGFREFCMRYHIPMPPGAVCNSIEDVQVVISELQTDCIIKADEGTGGAELGSNTPISFDDYIKALMEGQGEAHIAEKISHLVPSQPPYDVQQKLTHVSEGSLHIFIDADGKSYLEPTVFGQFSHEGSYTGGHFPNKLPTGFNSKMLELANTIIIPSLQAEGATGMHCMDCLFNPDTEDVFFIEDNTRPGALDFIHHFAMKVAETHQIENPNWYHFQLPIKQIAGGPVPFTKLQEILQSGDENLLTPGDNCVLISNPNVLSYGYDAHITGFSGGQHGSPEQAKLNYEKAVNKLISYYHYQGEVHIPSYEV